MRKTNKKMTANKRLQKKSKKYSKKKPLKASAFKTKKSFMSHTSARKFIIKKKITTKNEFQDWSRTKKRPKNFPSNPRMTYKEQWKGWGYFLGTGRTAENRKNFMNYKKAQQFIQKQKIQTKPMFEKWSRTKKRPDNFPSNPHQTYLKKWKGWKHFLGTDK